MGNAHTKRSFLSSTICSQGLKSLTIMVSVFFTTSNTLVPPKQRLQREGRTLINHGRLFAEQSCSFLPQCWRKKWMSTHVEHDGAPWETWESPWGTIIICSLIQPWWSRAWEVGGDKCPGVALSARFSQLSGLHTTWPKWLISLSPAEGRMCLHFASEQGTKILENSGLWVDVVILWYFKPKST